MKNAHCRRKNYIDLFDGGSEVTETADSAVSVDSAVPG